MTRKILVCVGLLAIAAGIALSSSNNVKEREDRLASLNQEILAEQDRIRILTAEWHTLRAPERVETLAARHLQDMHPSTPTQIAALTSLPDPLPTPAPAAELADAAPEAPQQVAMADAPARPAPVATPRSTVRPAAARPAASRPAAARPAAPTHREMARAAQRPAQRPAASAPGSAPGSIEEIIAASENPFRSAVSADDPPPARRISAQSDELSELIERQPSDGIVWASAGGAE